MDEEPVRLPITDVFDLHTIAPRDAQDAVEAYLEEAHLLGLRALRIIHGRGIGVQREMVRTVLARTPFVHTFGDAPPEAGGWGATIVTLGEVQSVAAAKPGLSEELAGLVNQYDAALDDAENLVAGLSAAQFNWRDRPGRWSIGECLEHLTRVGALYAGKVRLAVDDGRRRGMYGSGPFRYGWIESFFMRTMEPPPRFRVPAPEKFRPVPDEHERDRTVAAYRDVNRAIRGLVVEANGLDLRRIQTASPISGMLTWSLGIVLATNVAHDRRHLWQARQVMKLAGFPEN